MAAILYPHYWALVRLPRRILLSFLTYGWLQAGQAEPVTDALRAKVPATGDSVLFAKQLIEANGAKTLAVDRHADAARPVAEKALSGGTDLPDRKIVFSISNDKAPPLAIQHIDGSTSGILRDIGEAIAHELKLEAKFIALPRKRLQIALQDGSVDGICHSQPAWIDTPLNWSEPFLANENLILAGENVPAAATISELRDESIGTVMGYRYPEIEKVLGSNFSRDDSPSIDLALKKLMHRRFRYVVIDRLSLDYQISTSPNLAHLSTLRVSTFVTSCGFSKSSRIPFSRVSIAIKKLVDSGQIDVIVRRYVTRPAPLHHPQLPPRSDPD